MLRPVTKTIAVVLSARNEARLAWLERQLKKHKIKHKAIREPDAPWDGQLMAIGLHPCERSELLAKLFKDYQLLGVNVANMLVSHFDGTERS